MVTDAEVQSMERRIDDIEKMQQANSLAIGILTSNVDKLTVSTQGIVDVWSAGRTLQAAVKWLSGFSFVAAVIAWWTGKIG